MFLSEFLECKPVNIKFVQQLCRGHRVASGKAKDPRFPKGTISMQKPHFEKCGFIMDKFFLGTINLDISPFGYELVKPAFHVIKVRWSPVMPPENFFIFSLSFRVSKKLALSGYIYLPHPSTKPGFFQPDKFYRSYCTLYFKFTLWCEVQL